MIKTDVSSFLIGHEKLSECLVVMLFLLMTVIVLPLLILAPSTPVTLWILLAVCVTALGVYVALYKWDVRRYRERQSWPVNPRYLMAGIVAWAGFSIMTLILIL